MKEVILCKYGEIALKGANRRQFENMLLRSLRYRFSFFGKFEIYSVQSTIYVEPQGDCDLEETYKACRQIFGIAAVARAVPCEKTIEAIVETAKPIWPVNSPTPAPSRWRASVPTRSII